MNILCMCPFCTHGRLSQGVKLLGWRAATCLNLPDIAKPLSFTFFHQSYFALLFFLATPLDMWDFGSHQDGTRAPVVEMWSLKYWIIRDKDVKTFYFLPTLWRKKLYLIFLCTFISLIIGEVEYLFKFCGLIGLLHSPGINKTAFHLTTRKALQPFFFWVFLLIWKSALHILDTNPSSSTNLSHTVSFTYGIF